MEASGGEFQKHARRWRPAIGGPFQSSVGFGDASVLALRRLNTLCWWTWSKKYRAPYQLEVLDVKWGGAQSFDVFGVFLRLFKVAVIS